MPVKIIILGKPNVGKSSLFNMILKKNIAIVDNLPGLTIDLRKKKITLWGLECEFVDSPGLVNPSNETEKKIKNNTIEYSKLSDLIIIVFDGKSDLSYEDSDIIVLARKFNKPILLVVNKTEGNYSQNILNELNKSGLGKPILVSAAHNQSIDQLKWQIYLSVKDLKIIEENDGQFNDFSIAIIGKTNTGKSTMFNLIKKKKIAITGSQPNLTKDSIETNVSFKNSNFKMFDTAGFSKSNKERVHELAINQTLKKIRLCNVLLIVLDINNYYEKINSKILSLVNSENRCHVLLINKIDSVGDFQQQKIKKHLQDLNPQMKKTPVLFVSAKKNIGFENLHSIIEKQLKSWKKRIRTSDLNEWLGKIMTENPPPLKNGRAVKLKFASQVSISPPKFNIFSNHPGAINNQYKKYLSNKLKRSFYLEDVPIKIRFKKTNNPYE